jgi:hypothetical protein
MEQNPSRRSTQPLARLQQWYALQCNGDWEHEFGVKIDTLDNPGWVVDIDLMETNLEGAYNGRIERAVSNKNWIDITITDEKFLATGDAGQLDEIISQFLYFAENKCPSDKSLL